MTRDRLLITGATGFVGRWTLRHWRTCHPEAVVWATSNVSSDVGELADEFVILDLRDGDAVRELAHACHPTQVIHLAGLLADAPLADHLAINVLATESLYEALARIDPFGKIRIVQAGTAAMYGHVAPEELPVSEKNPMRPLTTYAISKMTQDYLAEMFWRTRGLGVIRARIFNLVGPGQPGHLVPATFIRQLRAMQDDESLKVGNLASRRDFVDVRDVVWAFDRLLVGGRPGEAYNVASGTSTAIGDIVNELLRISGRAEISVEETAMRRRRNDVSDIYADTAAIRQTVGWQPQIVLRESLQAMWNDDGCR